MNNQTNTSYANQLDVVHSIVNPKKHSTEDMELLTRISNFLDHRLTDENITLPDVAEAAFLSRTQLFRRVKKATGKSPSSYLRSLRLHKAKSLLKQADMRISEVAWAVGFRDTSYFSRTFRKEFGLSPRQHKKRFYA